MTCGIFATSRKTITATEILKMEPTLRNFLSLTLKLATNQLHTSSSNWFQGSYSKGTLIEFLSRIISTQRLSHGDQSKLQCVSLQLYLFSMTQTWKLSNFLVEYLSLSRLVCLAFKFFIQLSLQTAGTPCDFPFAVVFVTWACHMNFRSFCKIKNHSKI